jgi:O-acetylhomoserine (thiol)-lyase
MKKELKKESICVQGGWAPKKGEPRVLPIYQSTTFKYDNSEQMARLFDLEDSGYFYTRLQNPTNDAVAAKAALTQAISAIDKAKSKGVFHKNNASRKVSRLTKMVNKIA